MVVSRQPQPNLIALAPPSFITTSMDEVISSSPPFKGGDKKRKKEIELVDGVDSLQNKTNFIIVREKEVSGTCVAAHGKNLSKYEATAARNEEAK